MCTVSMIMDHYHDKWQQIPSAVPNTSPYMVPTFAPTISPISAEEIAEFRKLLERAREYDRRMGEPDCELESKKQALLTLAKTLGVEINFL